MIRYLPFGVSLVVIIVTGCSDSKPPERTRRSAMMTTTTKPKNPRAILTGTLLRPGMPIVTNQIHRVEIAREEDNRTMRYTVLFGPYPEIQFAVTTQTAEGTHLSDENYFILARGWAIASGDWPLAETDLVTVGAEGTTFILQIDGDVHRVILIALSKTEYCTVTRKAAPGDALTWTSSQDSYIEYRAGDPWPPTTRPVSDNEDLELFVKVALERAAAASLPDAPRIRLHLRP